MPVIIPYVPRTITVHLGLPNQWAENVTVAFPDYVKNVASSEIYPTWEPAAIRANVLAIISFALNRVYTEFYPSQGYDFQITSTTQFDQKFIPGRNIFENISQLVDEIFNDYIRRQGFVEPLAAKFCNGTTSTCDGLSQWGSQELAQDGLNSMEILRYYYGDDIELVVDAPIQDLITSYPGAPLRLGSAGPEVSVVQAMLNRISQNYPAIPKVPATGAFGEATESAVRTFQRIFNLVSDGVVGKATWNKLSYLYASVTRLAELDSEGTSLGIGTVPPTSVLRPGSSGQDVITLQFLLNMAAEFNSTIPAPRQDGNFGSETQQSVVAFQRAQGLTPDGIVGPLTWQALYNTYLGIDGVLPPDTDAGVTEYVVRPGDSLWLIAQRYHTSVDAIKRLNGLTSDNLNIGQILKIPSAGTTPAPYFEYTVRSGDSLWLLAQRFGTTVDAIKRLNGLSSDNLSIGQVLRIPNG